MEHSTTNPGASIIASTPLTLSLSKGLSVLRYGGHPYTVIPTPLPSFPRRRESESHYAAQHRNANERNSIRLSASSSMP